MKKSFAICGATLAAGVLWTGLHLNTALAKAKVQQELNESYPLTTNGLVHVDNVNGKVRVTAWDRPEVQMHALKRGDDQAALDALKIEIEARPNEVRIHTKYPNSRWKWSGNKSADVDYELMVPSHARLESAENVNGAVELNGLLGPVRASTVNGRLNAQGLGSDASLESVNGMVDASFRTLKGVKEVSLKTVNGKVKLQLPADADAEIKAKTLNGSIHGGPDLPARKQWPVGVDLQGKLGKGGARISAETVNGSINITPSESTAQNQLGAQPDPPKLEDDK
jgi:hypothetical protein